MPFTNEDLKRLKEQMERENFEFQEYLQGRHMNALIARLEAAEAVAEFAYKQHRSSPGIRFGLMTEAFEKWRKASGKEG